jgi:hypothetical protein
VSVTPGSPLYAVEGIFDSKPLQLAPPGTPLWQTRYGAFAPRLGAAYQIAPSTILRGGAGEAHDLGYGRLLGNLISGFPYVRTATRSGSGQRFDPADPIFEPPPLSTSLSTLTSGGLTAFDPELQAPSVLQWNIALEQAVGSAQSLTLTYLGASGNRLLRPDFVVPPGSGVPVSVTRNAGDSRYQALQVQFVSRLSHGLQALTSYTLAESRDRESDDGGGNFLGAVINANYATSLSAVYVPPLAPSDFDIRHSFSTAVSYEIPAPGWSNTVGAILRDWGVDAIVRASSAPPLNVRIEGVSPELGAYRTQPDLVPGQPIWLSAPDEPGGRILNPDAFTLPPTGAPGNFARNSIRSPFAINQTDLALRRRIALEGGTSLEFRAEVFNLFNHPMFGGPFSPNIFWGRCSSQPCTGQQSASFGRVVGDTTLNQGLGGDTLSGGQSAIYAIGGPRSIQLSARLRF